MKGCFNLENNVENKRLFLVEYNLLVTYPRQLFRALRNWVKLQDELNATIVLLTYMQ